VTTQEQQLWKTTNLRKTKSTQN